MIIFSYRSNRVGYIFVQCCFSVFVISTVPVAGDETTNNANSSSFSISGRIVTSLKLENSSVYDFKDSENNSFSVAATLKAKSPSDKLFGLGLELASWTDFGLGIADSPRVSQAITPNLSGRWRRMSDFEISQAFLRYSPEYGVFKVGRQAVMAKRSPWIFSDRSAGVVDISYDMVSFSKVDSDGTSFGAAWFSSAVNIDTHIRFGESSKGIFMLSFAKNTPETIRYSLYCYYYPDRRYKTIAPWSKLKSDDIWSIWATIHKDMGNIPVGLQLVYVDGENSLAKETLGLSAKVYLSYGEHDFTVTGSYLNGGDYSLRTAGMRVGSSSFWGKSLSGEFGADTMGVDQIVFRIDYNYERGPGRLYGGLAGIDYGFGTTQDKAFAYQIGYAYSFGNFFIKTEYRHKNTILNIPQCIKRDRIRFDMVYNF